MIQNVDDELKKYFALYFYYIKLLIVLNIKGNFYLTLVLILVALEYGLLPFTS